MILDVFEYNQHFVAMMNIINMSRLNPPKSGHKHHIVPKCWLKMNNLPIDNSKDNLVLLSYENHVKVHKLAYMCAKGSTFKGKMAYAYHKLTQGDVVSNDCFKGEKCAMYGKHHSDETKRKISEARKGKHHSEETRRKMSEALKGEKNPFYCKHHSEEQCKKWSEMRKGMPSGNKGKTMSIDSRRKISEAQKGKHHTEETRRKMSDANKCENNPMYGKHHSEETRRKMSEALKGKHHTEESRKKISEKMKGRTSPLKNRTWKLIDGKRVWIPKE